MELKKKSLDLLCNLLGLICWISYSNCCDKVYDGRDGEFLRPAPRAPKPKIESKLAKPKPTVPNPVATSAQPDPAPKKDDRILRKLAKATREKQVAHFKRKVLPKFKHLVDSGATTENELRETFLRSLKQYDAAAEANARLKECDASAEANAQLTILKSESNAGATSSTSYTQ